MNTLEILENARALILDPKRWTQGMQTRESQLVWNEGEWEREVFAEPQHCAVGALRNAGNGNRIKDASAALRAVIPGTSIFRYNDTTSHTCVIAAFDAAIECEKQKDVAPSR